MYKTCTDNFFYLYNSGLAFTLKIKIIFDEDEDAQQATTSYLDVFLFHGLEFPSEFRVTHSNFGYSAPQAGQS